MKYRNYEYGLMNLHYWKSLKERWKSLNKIFVVGKKSRSSIGLNWFIWETIINFFAPFIREEVIFSLIKTTVNEFTFSKIPDICKQMHRWFFQSRKDSKVQRWYYFVILDIPGNVWGEYPGTLNDEVCVWIFLFGFFFFVPQKTVINNT